MVESIPYHLDFDNLTSGLALQFAGNEQFNPNGIYSDRYAQVIIDAGYNSVVAFEWAYKFNTYLNEMAQIILDRKDFANALDWTRFIKTHHQEMFNMVRNNFTSKSADNYCYVMSEWFQDGMIDRPSIKLDIIKNDCIDMFMNYLWNNWADYSMDDFYSDLLDEYKIGVMI